MQRPMDADARERERAPTTMVDDALGEDPQVLRARLTEAHRALEERQLRVEELAAELVVVRRDSRAAELDAKLAEARAANTALQDSVEALEALLGGGRKAATPAPTPAAAKPSPDCARLRQVAGEVTFALEQLRGSYSQRASEWEGLADRVGAAVVAVMRALNAPRGSRSTGDLTALLQDLHGMLEAGRGVIAQTGGDMSRIEAALVGLKLELGPDEG